MKSLAGAIYCWRLARFAAHRRHSLGHAAITQVVLPRHSYVDMQLRAKPYVFDKLGYFQMYIFRVCNVTFLYTAHTKQPNALQRPSSATFN